MRNTFLFLFFILMTTSCQVRSPRGRVDQPASPASGGSPAQAPLPAQGPASLPAGESHAPEAPESRGNSSIASLSQTQPFVISFNAGFEEVGSTSGLWDVFRAGETQSAEIGLLPTEGVRAEVHLSAQRPGYRGELRAEWIGATEGCAWDLRQSMSWDEPSGVQTWVIFLSSPACGSMGKAPLQLRLSVPGGERSGMTGSLAIPLRAPKWQSGQRAGFEQMQVQLNTTGSGNSESSSQLRSALIPALSALPLTFMMERPWKWKGAPPAEISTLYIDLPVWPTPRGMRRPRMDSIRWALYENGTSLAQIPVKNCTLNQEGSQLVGCKIPVGELFKKAGMNLLRSFPGEKIFQFRLLSRLELASVSTDSNPLPFHERGPWPFEVVLPFSLSSESLESLTVRYTALGVVRSLLLRGHDSRAWSSSAATSSLSIQEPLNLETEPLDLLPNELERFQDSFSLQWSDRDSGLAPSRLALCGGATSQTKRCVGWAPAKRESGEWGALLANTQTQPDLPFEAQEATHWMIELSRFGQVVATIKIPFRVPPDQIRWEWVPESRMNLSGNADREGPTKIGTWKVVNDENDPAVVELPSQIRVPLRLGRVTYGLSPSSHQELAYRIPFSLQEFLRLDGPDRRIRAFSVWAARALRVSSEKREHSVNARMEFRVRRNEADSGAATGPLMIRIDLPGKSQREIDVFVAQSAIVHDIWTGRLALGAAKREPRSILNYPICRSPQYGSDRGICGDQGSCESAITDPTHIALVGRSAGACLACSDQNPWACLYCESSQDGPYALDNTFGPSGIQKFCRDGGWEWRSVVQSVPVGEAVGPLWLPRSDVPTYRLKWADGGGNWFQQPLINQDWVVAGLATGS